MKKTIKLILLISWLGLIYYFSSQVASESSKVSSGLLAKLYVFYRLFGKLSLSEYLIAFSKLIRKIAHFSEYFILGILSYTNMKEYFKDNHHFVSILFCMICAIVDETHQLFVPGRAYGVIDILIDSCGSVLAIILCHLIIKRWLKKY
ncbi:MAG: VanZ family protein [Firmicutes bacterium]|nr:VanZ family protein [Candidatus Colivicinus equi]